MGTQNKEIKFQKAILRVDDEPLLRYVARRSDGVILVKSEGSYKNLLEDKEVSEWISWHEDDIYRYDPVIFKELSTLFASKDKKRLKETWLKIKNLF
jgi:hypothetical protein